MPMRAEASPMSDKSFARQAIALSVNSPQTRISSPGRRLRTVVSSMSTATTAWLPSVLTTTMACDQRSEPVVGHDLALARDDLRAHRSILDAVLLDLGQVDVDAETGTGRHAD